VKFEIVEPDNRQTQKVFSSLFSAFNQTIKFLIVSQTRSESTDGSVCGKAITVNAKSSDGCSFHSSPTVNFFHRINSGTRLKCPKQLFSFAQKEPLEKLQAHLLR
jgi:hypothetical protein